MSCPVCSSKSTKTITTISSQRSAIFFSARQSPNKQKKLERLISKLWSWRKSCNIVKCSNCSFIFSEPYVGGTKEFYDLAFQNQDKSSYPDWKWEFDIGISRLKKSSKYNPKILEIGCGRGAFLKRISKLKISKNLIGLEYSDYGIKETKKIGIDCFAKDLREFASNQPNETFDFVFIFQVLEHLDYTNKLFQLVSNLLKKGGELIIAVPNPKKSSFNFKNNCYRDIPPHHIGCYVEKTFEYLANNHGFSLEMVKIEPYNFRETASLLYAQRYHRFIQKNYKNRFLLKMVNYNICRKLIMYSDLIFNPMILLRLIFQGPNIGGGSQVAVFSKL